MNIKEIILLEEVALDIKIAKEFYENQNQGLGNYFKDTIISDIESLWLYAGIHIKVFDTHRLLSKRFPYAIYYKIDSNIVIVIAVLDLRQNPKSISKFISNRKK
ncbi:type II toxin-antitoxin system RelE/ParE family toxin [Halarcobacter sp.]|uniref:type II toxin-antitoxin system RelE/ParE family toxin n=1 Tax=Halarcobacter sp. TaxID=2321133 RepID=UPI003A94642D